MHTSRVNATYSVVLDAFFGENDLYDPSDHMVTFDPFIVCVSSGLESATVTTFGQNWMSESMWKRRVARKKKQKKQKKETTQKQQPARLGRQANMSLTLKWSRPSALPLVVKGGRSLWTLT